MMSVKDRIYFRCEAFTDIRFNNMTTLLNVFIVFLSKKNYICSFICPTVNIKMVKSSLNQYYFVLIVDKNVLLFNSTAKTCSMQTNNYYFDFQQLKCKIDSVNFILTKGFFNFHFLLTVQLSIQWFKSSFNHKMKILFYIFDKFTKGLLEEYQLK